MNSMAQFKLGAVFEHSRFLEADLKTPMRFRVTKVAQGAVYYRPVGGGGSHWCAIATFPEKVKQWIPADSV